MGLQRCTQANVSTIGKSGQQKLSGATVGIAGLGGVGGIAFQLLVRSGIGAIRISDSGFFEESNANRQALWTKEADGRKKAEVAAEFAKNINPQVRVAAFPDITAASSRKFASGCSCVIDATDRRHSRLLVWKGCNDSGTPYIFASALGAKGMLTVFRGKGMPRELGIESRKAPPFMACDHSLGPVANMAGCLAAQQAINIILKKPVLLFPKVASIDAFSSEPLRVHRF